MEDLSYLHTEYARQKMVEQYNREEKELKEGKMLSPQYLEERRRGIGGSDVAAIMGLSPWRTAYRVYQEKRKEVEDWEGNKLTDWGTRLEPAIRQWYSDTTGHSVRLPDKIMYHPQHDFMLASLDGFTDEPRGVEIKTARNGRYWGDPGTNQIPDYYMLQVQHYMIVTGFPVFDVAVSIAGSPPELYEVPADAELQEMIIEAELRFWARVKTGTPPEPVTYADAVARYGRSSTVGHVTATQESLDAYNVLKSVRDKLDVLKALEEDARGRLIIALGDAGDTLVDVNGDPLITYKQSRPRTSFDKKALEKEMPDIYQKYLTTGEPTKRFLIK